MYCAIYESGVPKAYNNNNKKIAINHRLVVALKAGCIGKFGKIWLLNINPGTNSQSERYSSKING